MAQRWHLLSCRDKEVAKGPLGIYDFWETNQMPVSLRAENLLQTKPTQLEPQHNGTIFRLFEIPPVEKNLTAEKAEKKAAQAFAEAGATHVRVNTNLTPMMHETRTIDYVTLLKGEVTLLLDEGDVKLKPFDAVVQRGTNHYWINDGNTPALLMGVLIDAKE